MIFDPTTPCIETIPMSFGSMPTDAVARTLRDGRAASALVVGHLRSRFDNLAMASKERTDAECLVDDKERVWQVKMLTSNGMNLLPAKNLGCGRNFDGEAYRSALRRITGFLVVDITAMPRMTITAVPKSILPQKASFKYDEALKLLLGAGNAMRLNVTQTAGPTLAMAV